jgi:hypothetical protein
LGQLANPMTKVFYSRTMLVFLVWKRNVKPSEPKSLEHEEPEG